MASRNVVRRGAARAAATALGHALSELRLRVAELLRPARRLDRAGGLRAGGGHGGAGAHHQRGSGAAVVAERRSDREDAARLHRTAGPPHRWRHDQREAKRQRLERGGGADDGGRRRLRHGQRLRLPGRGPRPSLPADDRERLAGRRAAGWRPRPIAAARQRPGDAAPHRPGSAGLRRPAARRDGAAAADPDAGGVLHRPLRASSPSPSASPGSTAC